MEVYDSYSNNNNEFKVVRDDTVCYLAGNGLTLLNLETKEKRYIISKRNGFQAYATQPNNGLIAVVDYGINPLVSIYQYPELNLVQTLKGVSPLEIKQLDFTVDATRLLVITGVPSFELSIWDLRTEEQLQGKDSKIKIKDNLIKAEFSPENDNIFCILYETSIHVCTIIPVFENKENDTFRITINSLQNVDINKEEGNKLYKFVTFQWDNFGRLYLAHGFNVIYLNGDLTKVEHENNPIEITESIVTQILITQKHIILYHNRIEWIFRYEPNNLESEEFKPFKADKQYADDNIEITFMKYNYLYTKIFAITSEGTIMVFDKPAESNQIVEDEEVVDQNPNDSSDDDEGSSIQVENEVIEVYHQSDIVLLKEVNKLNLISVSKDGKIFCKDLQSKLVLSQLKVEANIISGTVTNDQNVLILGSDEGVIRIVDISQAQEEGGIILKHMIRLWKQKEVSQVKLNESNSHLCISSVSSKKIFFLEGNGQFQILGFIKLPVRVNNFIWHDNKIIVLCQFLLLSFDNIDDQQRDHMNLQYTPDIYYRKIDPDLHYICILNNFVYVSGLERTLKKYKLPDDLISKIDLKTKQPVPPLDEIQGAPLRANQMESYGVYIVIGSQDGSLTFINPDNNSNESYKVNNQKHKGTSIFSISSQFNLVYTGGYEGSVFVWKNDKQLQSLKCIEDLEDMSEKEKDNQNEYMIEQLEVMDQKDNLVTFYSKVLEQNYIQQQKERMDASKQQILQGIESIKQDLNKLLDANEQADELEKLNRDDFAIDTITKNRILEEGKEKRIQLQQTAKRENLRTQLLHQIIKEKSWDLMDEQLKGINSLNSNILVYNYHIRKRDEAELRKLKIVKNFRRVELKEKQLQQENNIKQILGFDDLQQKQDLYTINAIQGKQKMVLVDYQKKAEEEAKEDEKNQKTTAHGSKGGIGDRKGLGARQKKQEDKKEEIKEEVKEKEEKKEEDKGENDWDYLYGALDLFTNNRRRNQIVLLQNIIFHIKKDFNSKFRKLVKQRSDAVDQINEKNKRFLEILEGLHRQDTPFEPKVNSLENPERILQVDPSEIEGEKYYTREERAQMEADRQKELERLRRLAEDDAGQRAIKQMMNGTLEEKKENPLDEELQKEDWMDKPHEELTEDQRFRLKEYEVNKLKQEEEKEKIRKNLENELKKIKNEINEICIKLDEKLLLLFKQKLEYDYRILEQEQYIVRLSISIIFYKDAQNKKKFYEDDIKNDKISLEQIEQMQRKLTEKKAQLDAVKANITDQFNNVFKNQSQETMKDIKTIWVTIFEKDKNENMKKRRNQDKDNDFENDVQIVQLDPYVEIKKKNIKNQKALVFNTYELELNESFQNKQSINKDDTEQINQIVKVMASKFEVMKQRDSHEKIIINLNESVKYYQDMLDDRKLCFKQSIEDDELIRENLEKYQSCIEVILRFQQGLVEISQNNQDKPVPNLSDAVLINTQLITQKNNEIILLGKEKIKKMEAIKDINFQVQKAKYDLEKKKLNIEKTQLSIKEVQLLKVKKEMQNALTKKDMKLNETALKRMQEQTDKLKYTTEKKIQIYTQKQNKIMEQIEQIEKENDTLKNQAEKLNINVQETKQLSDMKFKKQQVQIGSEDQQSNIDHETQEAMKKFKKISLNRKLFEMAKQQTEEIELLREELNKLKARTFANFSNVQKK